MKLCPLNNARVIRCESVAKLVSRCSGFRLGLRGFSGWFDYRAAGRCTQTESCPAAEFRTPPAFPLYAPCRAAPAGRRRSLNRPAGSAKPNRPSERLCRIQRGAAEPRRQPIKRSETDYSPPPGEPLPTDGSQRKHRAALASVRVNAQPSSAVLLELPEFLGGRRPAVPRVRRPIVRGQSLEFVPDPVDG